MFRSFFQKIIKKNFNFSVMRNKRPIFSDSFYDSSESYFSNQYFDSNTEYINNVIVYSVVNLLTKSTSSIKIKLFEYGDFGKKELTNSRFLDLINYPNPFQSGISLIESIVSYRLIHGDAYVVKVYGPDKKSPSELYVLNPNLIEVKLDDIGQIDSYVYRVGGKSRVYNLDKITGKSDILHFKNFNPYNPNKGLSAIIAAKSSIDQHNSSADWNKNLLKNSARPSGALIAKSPSSLSEEQYKRLKEQINNLYCGGFNAGRPLLLEGGIDWKEMCINPKDMEFNEVRNTAAREIAFAFCVPPYLLGIPGDNTYSNLSEARLAFYDNGVIPILNEILSVFNLSLFGAQSKNLRFEYDEYSIRALSVDKDKIVSQLNNFDFLTKNEKRRFLGLNPIEDTTLFEFMR